MYIGKALDHEIEGSHVQIGVDICKKYRENPQVIHAIEAHHGDVEPKTTLAFIIMAADAIPLPVPAPAARTWRATSSVWKHWRLSATALRASRAPTPCRQAARSASLSSPTRSAMTGQQLARNVAKKIENELGLPPGRSRSASSARRRATEYAK